MRQVLGDLQKTGVVISGRTLLRALLLVEACKIGKEARDSGVCDCPGGGEYDESDRG